jgi:hypothetical protein
MAKRRGALLVAVVAVIVAGPGCSDPDLYYRHQDAGGVDRIAVTTAGTAGTGAAGHIGTTGAAGTTAVAGTTGIAGTTGSAGTTGRAGTTGTGGTTGAAGITGAAGTGLPAPNAVLSDDFEDGDSMGWIADTMYGNWMVIPDGTGKVYADQMSDSNLSWAIGGKINWTDQVVSTRVKFTTLTSSSASAFLAVRYMNKDAYYLAYLKADGSLKIRKRVDGSTDDIATYKSNMPVVVGTWYTLGLSAVGTTLTASINGMMVATGTDSALTAGGIALGVQNAVASFDDVKVSPP